MLCLMCGSKTRTEKEKLWRYTDSGLLNVWLTNIQVHRCQEESCGQEEIVIQNLNSLHDIIATEIASGPRKLSPEEIRFLRTYLGFSSVDLAREVMMVTPETIAKWEKGMLPMKEASERLLRVLVLSRQEPFHKYEELKTFGTKPARSGVKRKFKLLQRSWFLA